MTTALAVKPTTALAARDPMGDMLADPAAFRGKVEVLGFFAASGVLPKHWNSAPALGVAMIMGAEMGIPMMEVIQNLTFPNGNPTWRADYVIDRINGSGLFRDPLDWTVTGSGDDLTVECYTHRHDGTRVSEVVTMREAKADGWARNEKYRTLPVLMLRYRSATRFWRLRAKGALRSSLAAETEAEESEAPPATPAPAVAAITTSMDALRAAASAAAVSEGAAHPGAPATVAAPAAVEDPDAEEKRRIVSWLGEQSRASEAGKRAVVEALAPTLAKDVGRLGLERLRAVAVAVRQALTPAAVSPDRQRLADLLGSESWPLDATPELAAHLGVQRVDVATLTDEQVESALRWVDGAAGGV